jgi:hypothetical protein
VTTADIRIRDYVGSDAEDLNRIAVSAFEEFRDQYRDWPGMLAGLSKTSDLSASGELIVAEFQNQFAGAVAYVGLWQAEGGVLRSELAGHPHAGGRPHVSRQGAGTRLECGMHRQGKTRWPGRDRASFQPDHERRPADVSQKGIRQSL